MQINIGYFYFIKDIFFEIIDDKELIKNKENEVICRCDSGIICVPRQYMPQSDG